MIHSWYKKPPLGELVAREMTEKSTSVSELDLVLARLSWQGHLVEVVEVGMAHGPLRRDSLCWIIHLATRSDCV